jgi:hypothetical protein
MLTSCILILIVTCWVLECIETYLVDSALPLSASSYTIQLKVSSDYATVHHQ